MDKNGQKKHGHPPLSGSMANGHGSISFGLTEKHQSSEEIEFGDGKPQNLKKVGANLVFIELDDVFTY